MKVNKRIGKLKQWTGEKLGGQQKTELSEDFQSLEQDVELRKAGIDKIYSVSKEYSKSLTRKSEAEGTDTGKVLPIDGLGLVCANHGDEFGSDSAFGQALIAFGRAQQQIAVSTTDFTESLNSNWLTSLEKSIAQMAEYTNQRKKLDSRRLTYDAMLAKVQKSKKEKRELEDDLRVAKNRYEETSEEVQERAIAIQDSESEQMAALSKLLEIQSSWIDEQKKILDDVKRNWVDPSAFRSVGSIGRKKGTAHSFGVEPPPPSKPSIKGKLGVNSRAAARSRYSEDEDEDDMDRSSRAMEERDEEEEEESDNRRRSRGTPTNKPRTLPPLAKEKPASTNYNGSNNKYGGVRIPGMPPLSTSGAASPHSDDLHSPTIESAHSRQRSNGSTLQQISPPSKRTPAAPSAKPSKILVAKWAYSATEGDELELSIGDRVKVTNEINSEWFVGRNESSGQSGMFPSAYCVKPEEESIPRRASTTVDMFADPEEEVSNEEEEQEGETNGSEDDESTALKPQVNRNLPSSKPTPTPKLVHSNSVNTASSSGKRAPPPPPPTRRATTTSNVPKPNQNSNEDDQPEAFGSVSELKKRLGMFK